MTWFLGWNPESYSSAVTALGLVLAVWQMRRSVKQARVAFEDGLNREYRQVLQSVPAKARFDTDLSVKEFEDAFPFIHQYFDLSNEQVFLRMNGRVSKVAWADWGVGMRSTLAKPAFAKAWSRVVESSTSFSELRRLETSQFQVDPYYWVSVAQRLKRWVRQ